MKQTWRIALAQLAVADGSKEENLQKIESAIEKAYLGSAEILVLPELVLSGSVSRNQILALAEERDGESLRKIQAMLAKYPLHLVYSFPEYVSDDEIFITTCFLDKNGKPLTYYRKTHLFTEERYIFTPGNKLVELDLDGMKLGLLTCYDIEFPEPARTLALRGAEILLVNSANMAPYEALHRNFIISRALENQCFVAYCNRVGSNHRYTYHGQSAVIGPDGKVLMDCEDDLEMVAVFEISLDQIKLAKSDFHYLHERRPELYHGI